MNDDPLISIVIPTYNGEKYLKRTILSALSQDYSKLEIIISDNASTDSTRAIVESFLDPRIHYYRNERNLGMVGNWSKSLKEYATGKYVLMISDDDYLIDNEYVSKAANLFNRLPNIVMVFANCKIIEENTNNISLTNYSLEEKMSGVSYLLHYYSENAPHIISTITTVFNKEKAILVDAFSRDVLGIDEDLHLRLMLEGDIGFIRDHVAVYTIRKGSMSNTIDLKNDLKYIEDLIEISNNLEKISISKTTIRNWLRDQTLLYFKWRSSTYLLHGKSIIIWILAIKIFFRVPNFLSLKYFRQLLVSTTRNMAIQIMTMGSSSKN